MVVGRLLLRFLDFSISEAFEGEPGRVSTTTATKERRGTQILSTPTDSVTL